MNPIKTYSLTYFSLIVAAIALIFREAGLDVAQTDIETAVTTAILFVSALGILYGRWRKGDLKWWGARK